MPAVADPFAELPDVMDDPFAGLPDLVEPGPAPVTQALVAPSPKPMAGDPFAELPDLQPDSPAPETQKVVEASSPWQQELNQAAGQQVIEQSGKIDTSGSAFGSGLRSGAKQVMQGRDYINTWFYKPIDAAFGTNLSKQFTEQLTRRQQEIDTIHQQSPKGFVNESIMAIGEQVPQMPAMLGGGALATMVKGTSAAINAVAALGGLQSASQAYSSRVAKRVKDGESVEAAAQSELVPSLTDGLITAAVTKGFGARGIESIFQKSGARGVMEKFVNTLKQAGWEVAEEMTDESVQMMNDLVNDRGLTLDEAFKRATGVIVPAAVLGGGITGVHSAMETAVPEPGKPVVESEAPPAPLTPERAPETVVSETAKPNEPTTAGPSGEGAVVEGNRGVSEAPLGEGARGSTEAVPEPVRAAVDEAAPKAVDHQQEIADFAKSVGGAVGVSKGIGLNPGMPWEHSMMRREGDTSINVGLKGATVNQAKATILHEIGHLEEGLPNELVELGRKNEHLAKEIAATKWAIDNAAEHGLTTADIWSAVKDKNVQDAFNEIYPSTGSEAVGEGVPSAIAQVTENMGTPPGAVRPAMEAKAAREAPKVEPEAPPPGSEFTEATAPVTEKAGKLRLKVDRGEGGFIDPPTLREVADFGRRIYTKGVDFVKWSADMISHLGEKIKPHLKTIWDSLTGKNILPHARESGGISNPFRLTRANDLNKATTERSAKLQHSQFDAKRAVDAFSRVTVGGKTRTLPESRRNAATIYAEANGDMTVIADWATKAKGEMFRKAAQDAQSLSVEEIGIANKARTVFDALGQRGINHEVMKSWRQNYVPHLFDLKKGPPRPGGGSRKLQQTFRHGRLGQFQTFFEADQAGYTPKTLDLAKTVPAYLSEMNKVIADRQMAADLVAGKAEDGSPLVIPTGLVQTVETPGKGTVYLANPDALLKAKDAAGNPIDTNQYRVFPDQPALHKWLWKGQDASGNPIMMRSDLALHPEAYKRIKSLFGTSGLHDVPAVSAISRVSGAMKREMFGFLAPFHQVQEGTHAIGHTVNPFFGLSDVNFKRPAVQDAAAHGLMLLPEGSSYGSYIEGVGTHKSLISRGLRKVGAGKVSDVIEGYQEYLFGSYIPRLKMTTYEHALARNMKRFSDDIASGKYSESDIKMLTGEQVNAAYGHLNYGLMDRSPTTQHTLQLGLLAPDFLEARTRFFGQAMKGLGHKAGREQLRAIAVLSTVQAGTALILSQLIPGGEWDPKDPFVLKVKNRKYMMRSVPEDFVRFATEAVGMATGKQQGSEFISARINPLLQSAMQMLSGHNYRGEKVSSIQTLEEAVAKFIPLTLRDLPFVRELTETSRNSPVSPLERLAGSLGLKVSRASPITDAYQLAANWQRSEGIKEDTGSYPISQYRQLRYALEDSDLDAAKTHYLALIRQQMQDKKQLPGVATDAVEKGFKQSVLHPFTGSKESDKKFKNSLSPEQRKLVDLAEEHRKAILWRFQNLQSASTRGFRGGIDPDFQSVLEKP